VNEKTEGAMVQFRKRWKFGPFSFGLSKRGLSISVGAGGVRVSKGADGKMRRTVGIPGTGVYDTKVIGARKAEPATKAVEIKLTGEGPPLTDGQREHLRRELEGVSTRNMPDLSAMTLSDGEAILDAIGGELFYVTQQRRAEAEGQ
jgi:Protein of unknown function (DUF4236)